MLVSAVSTRSQKESNREVGPDSWRLTVDFPIQAQCLEHTLTKHKFMLQGKFCSNTTLKDTKTICVYK